MMSKEQKAFLAIAVLNDLLAIQEEHDLIWQFWWPILIDFDIFKSSPQNVCQDQIPGMQVKQLQRSKDQHRRQCRPLK